MAKKRLDPAVHEYFKKLGQRGGAKGGHARAAKMTAQERSESARKAVKARWAKAKRKSKGA